MEEAVDADRVIVMEKGKKLLEGIPKESDSSTLFLISLGSIPKFSGPKATSSSTTVATIWLSA